jgi:hypothetical protein
MSMATSTATMNAPAGRTGAAVKPALGFVLLGGSLSGALVRDVRLANECARRGYDVHVWWAIDQQKTAGLLPQIKTKLIHFLVTVTGRRTYLT